MLLRYDTIRYFARTCTDLLILAYFNYFLYFHFFILTIVYKLRFDNSFNKRV